MRAYTIFCGLVALTVGFQPLASSAQDQFRPVVEVNSAAVTAFEIDQRFKLLEAFRTPGASPALAQEQLIEDRLKQGELARFGLVMTDEALQSSLEDFAGRANLTLDQFYTVLGQNGIAQETLQDFVGIGITWRDYIRSRFGPRVQVSPNEVDRAIQQAGGETDGIEVLLSEIIIAAPPPQAAQALATANRISETRSTDVFSAEARRVSALPSRTNGGRLDYLPISNYPPQLQSLILGLGIGEVTPPIPIPNGVALFQLRGIRETPLQRPAPVEIEYAAYYLSGGQAEARDLKDRVDTCDDLYGEAKGKPADVLERDSLPPAEIPQDVAIELARLDPGEVSFNLTRAGGQTTVFLMLCDRITANTGGVDRQTIGNQLRSTRLAGFSDALLADLRANATIVFP